MRWMASGALIALLGVSLMGCAGGTGMAGVRAGVVRIGDTRAAVIPPLGILYSRVRAPATANLPRSRGSRRGEATVSQIALPPLPFPGLTLGTPLFAWGDASQEEAAREGGVEQISHLDYEITTILMVYRRFKLIAYGE